MRSIIWACLFGCSLFAYASEPLVLSFEEAVEKAAQHSFASQKSRVDLLVSKAERVKTFTQMGPTFGFRYTDTTNDAEIRVPFNGQEILVQPLNTQQSVISIGLNLTAAVAGLIKIWSDSSVVSVSDKAKDLVEIESAYGVAEIYRLTQQAKLAVEVASSRLVSAKKQQNNTEYLLAYGKISKAEKLQVDFTFNNAELGLARAQHEYENAIETLKKLLDIPLGQEIILDEMKDVKADMVSDSPLAEVLLQEALQNRVDLQLASLTVDSYKSSSWLNLSSYFPLVQFDSNWQASGQNVSSFGVQRSQYLTFKVSWQFWDNGASIVDFRKTRLLAHKAEIDLREKLLHVDIDTKASKRNLELAKKTLLARERGLEQAKEAFRGFEARFSLGAVSVTDFLFAEGILNQAKLDHLAAKVGLDVAYMKMQKALGKTRPMPL